MDSDRHRYLPLDGLRALAITAVFCFHYRVRPNSPADWGWVGVDLFFVLSGYLITGILYDSLNTPGYFRNFYIRRALRIFPVYWAVWCVIGLLVLFVPQGHPDPWYLAWPLYLGNYVDLHAIHNGLPTGHYDLAAIIHALGEKFYIRVGPYWSLCVEEQYYLLWPLVVWLVRDRVRLLRVCAFGMAAILALRIGLHFWMSAAWVRDDEVYFFTFTRADTLLAGALLALWSRGRGGLQAIPARWVLPAGAAALAGIVLSAAHWGLFHGKTVASWMQTYGYTLLAIVMASVLLAALRLQPFARVLAFRPLVALGQVSYGFYLFHLMFYDCARIPIDATSSRLVHFLIDCGIFAFIWTLSWLSFRYFETPFLRLKARWTTSTARPAVSLHAPTVQQQDAPAA